MTDVAVIGYGLMGKERVRALCELRDEGESIGRIVVCDPRARREKEMTNEGGVTWCETADEALSQSPDWVIVATPHDVAVAVAGKALPSGARVLMEKPFGRSLAEAERLVAQMRFPGQITVGLNYRFLPGVAAFLEDLRTGRFGPLISIQMVLGHGGAPGMNESWKFDPVRGGGCLLDPGIHLFDLCRQISGQKIEVRRGWKWSGFWKTGIIEEAQLLLDAGSFLVNLQVSLVRWRNTFLLEAHGVDGYGVVTGRGGCYGPQRYRRGQRWAWLDGTPQETTEEEVCVSDCRDSFRDELRALFRGAEEPDKPHPCTAAEALEAMRLYQSCLDSL
ncbi:MAG TPA: Gfo/Idh/MocA family oxidoreductase [Chthoniobacter sp.]|jgi:predicted dehydrogenase